MPGLRRLRAGTPGGGGTPGERQSRRWGKRGAVRNELELTAGWPWSRKTGRAARHAMGVRNHPAACERSCVIYGRGFSPETARGHDLRETSWQPPGEGARLLAGYKRGWLRRGHARGLGGDARTHSRSTGRGSRRHAATARPHLELYTLGRLRQASPYEGRSAGSECDVIPVGTEGTERLGTGVRMAHRFHEEVPGSELTS